MRARLEASFRFGAGLLLGRRGRWVGRKLLSVEERPIAARETTDRVFTARVYVPRGAQGAFLVSPGMQPFGHDDDRMDRFARVLAGAGFVTMVPCMPDNEALRMDPRSAGDLGRALASLLEGPGLPTGCRPALFGLSIGSYAAATLAGDPRWRETVRSLFLFGGYSRWLDTLRYALGTGRTHSTPPDGLLRPVVFINLAEHFPGDEAERAALREALHRFVVVTWRNPQGKEDAFVREKAAELAATLPIAIRDAFLMGCGVLPGGERLAEEMLDEGMRVEGASRGAALDLTKSLARLTCPVHVIHGIDDNVIPVEHAQEILDAIPAGVPRSAYILRGFGHNGETAFRALARAPLRVSQQVLVQLRLAGAVGALGG